jgi:hypothetical protein
MDTISIHQTPSSTISIESLKNGEIWAIDTTGAQCGYADPLCPWRDFEQHRSSKINREYEFGYIRHQVFQSHGMFPVRHIVAQKVEKEDLAKALEEQFVVVALVILVACTSCASQS